MIRDSISLVTKLSSFSLFNGGFVIGDGLIDQGQEEVSIAINFVNEVFSVIAVCMYISLIIICNKLFKEAYINGTKFSLSESNCN